MLLLAAIDGMSMTIGGATGAAIVSAVVKIWASRNARTEISPNPLSVEQTAYQAKMKENEKDHENLFFRMSAVEKEVAGIKAETAAQTRILDRMVSRIDALYDRIILGGKKK